MARELGGEIALFTQRRRAVAVPLGADDKQAEVLTEETCTAVLTSVGQAESLGRSAA